MHLRTRGGGVTTLRLIADSEQATPLTIACRPPVLVRQSLTRGPGRTQGAVSRRSQRGALIITAFGEVDRAGHQRYAIGVSAVGAVDMLRALSR